MLILRMALIRMTLHHDTYDIMKAVLQMHAEIITNLPFDRIVGLSSRHGVGRSGEMLWEGTQRQVA